MNTEELESSLRAEFENYLKGLRDEMRQHAAELQDRFESELENHRNQMTEAVKAYSERLESEHPLDEGFTSTVVEHLRLARDEGSRLTAEAMAEAEDLRQKTDEQSVAPADYSGLRDAINDISRQDSQSAILRSLVTHAAEYAPRGAFFVVKNENFVGWKVFGDHTDEAESAVRDVHFPVAANTVLGEAVRSLSTTDAAAGADSDNDNFLTPLHFGHPDRMYAVPLIARGRGVAVLYVDYGTSGLDLNVEALETLVRIAGLTVELLAATHTATVENRQVAAADLDTPAEAAYSESETAAEQEPSSTEFAVGADEGETESFVGDEIVHEDGSQTDHAFSPSFESDTSAHPFGDAGQAYDQAEFGANEPQVEHGSLIEPSHDLGQQAVTAEFESPESEGAMSFDSSGPIGTGVAESSPFETAAAQFEPAVAVGTKPEASIEVSASNTGFARLSDRPVDLPIQVPDDERRLHNDARRFARLLVSEIKLYNEKKVQEGRQASDLYERLREAIDRSREMYDKRVQPPVAARFDYFHYELVNALADGEVDRLGEGYPGSKV